MSRVITLHTQPYLSPEDLKKLTDFFSLLIRIDQRQKAEQKRSANVSKTPRKEASYV